MRRSLSLIPLHLPVISISGDSDSDFYFPIVLKILLCENKSWNIHEEWRWIQNPVVYAACLWKWNSGFHNNFNPLTACYFSPLVRLWMFIGFLIHFCWFYFRCIFSTNHYGPPAVSVLGITNGGIAAECGICSNVVIKTPQPRQWPSMNCCLLRTCFTLPSIVSVVEFGYVIVCGALLVVNVYF